MIPHNSRLAQILRENVFYKRHIGDGKSNDTFSLALLELNKITYSNSSSYFDINLFFSIYHTMCSMH